MLDIKLYIRFEISVLAININCQMALKFQIPNLILKNLSDLKI